MKSSRQSSTFSSLPYFLDRDGHGIAQPITERVHPHSRPIVTYYSPRDVGFFHYGENHPMKPFRLTLTNALIKGYGLDKRIHKIYDVRAATQEELEAYHDHEYIDFLSKVDPRNPDDIQTALVDFNCGDDCPVFSGVYDFCRMYAGGSLAAARKVCAGGTDIAINWSGGLHHAKRGEPSGFCYVNDIVLAILELLKYYPRVLYIDIDIHHGDGVEQAFYRSNRVMTLSFHKYDGERFFPATGNIEDNGVGIGKHFCLNVPLKDGINDEMYTSLFKAVTQKTFDSFQPSVIVLQCGADSLGCDRIGAFNLSIAAHGECVNFVKKLNVPMLALGGGGYTVKNVSRCWTYETSVLVGVSIPNELPQTEYDAFFADSQFKLHPPISGKVNNQNSPDSIRRIVKNISEKLRYLQGAPSVAMQELPPHLEPWMDDWRPEEREEIAGNKAAGESRSDHKIAPNEFDDGEKDVDSGEPIPEALPEASQVSTRSIRSTRSAVNMEESGTEDSTPPPRRSARGRGRGRRRGTRSRGRGARVAVDVDRESSVADSEDAE